MSRKNARLLIPIISILTAFAVSSLIMFMAGRDPVMIFQKMFRATFGSPYGNGQVVFRMTTLVLVGLAVAIPFQVRLFNIGAEGQLQMGAFAAAMTGAMLPASLPPLAAIPICIISAMAAGACWALLAGVLKVRFGVNEVITTIMLNFIAQGITGYLLTWHFAIPSTVHTAPITDAANIPAFDAITGWFAKSPANLSALLAAAAALLFQVLLFQSRYGYEMRAAGLQPEAARYGGIKAGMHTLTAMGIGGAAAGLGAANIVLGYKHYYESGMTGGIGFTGIAVALLAGAHPLWILLSAFFFGVLEYGGLTVNAYIPKDIFMIIEALTILLVIVFSALGRRIPQA
ncbi:MAG: ABC transporter permease [Chlorobiaceae bacterium]|nr:ABC transporter permease [Chlorobiaceae bacterium]